MRHGEASNRPLERVVVGVKGVPDSNPDERLCVDGLWVICAAVRNGPGGVALHLGQKEVRQKEAALRLVAGHSQPWPIAFAASSHACCTPPRPRRPRPRLTVSRQTVLSTPQTQEATFCY